MTTPNNIVRPVWNQALITGGSKFVEVPNEFSEYDEVWYHLQVHGTNGAPASGNIIVTWQMSHPQNGGGYHDEDPIWQDIRYEENSHMFHSGLTFPYKIVRTVPTTFSPIVDYVRGVRLSTGRIRLKLITSFGGGTTPSYTMSLSIYARRATPDMKPIPRAKQLPANNTIYDYVRDVWGYTIRNKDSAAAKVMLKNGSISAVAQLAEHLPADGSVTRMFERPIRFDAALYLEYTVGGANGVDIVIYTTDNIDT